MKVARYEVPGSHDKFRPVGNGMTTGRSREDENEAPGYQSASGLRSRDSKRLMASVGDNLL
jgi:hypothetical protein